MNYYEEEKITIDGIPYNIFCHVQNQTSPGLVISPHYHDYIELLYGLSGHFDVHLNNGLYQFGPGDLVLINSGEVHQIETSTEESGHYYVVRFEPDVIYTLSQNVLEMKYILPFTLNNYNHQKVFERGLIDNTILPEMIESIMSEFSDKNYGYELAIKAYICRIFLWILRYWNQSGIKSYDFYNADLSMLEKLQKVLAYVSTNYKEDIKVTDIAKMCNVSYSYFSRNFNKIMNTSFNDYLNYIRISEAEKLLITTDLNITEIAMKVGFSTSSYFIKQFKDHKKTSPKRYKKTFMETIKV